MPVSYTWPSGLPNPTHEWSSDEQPRVKTAQFGDGYAQTAKDGINALKRTWTVVFEPLKATDKTTIVNFLRARGGSEPFYWTPPGDSQVKIKCKKWTVKPMSGPQWSISVEFEECFDA